ncbi:6433_t:CDS:2 [Cetraspora pellucida]|uniref:6433_t:CDS:1 n=1 Tax=Cetraspora pellucida TaxID=1433469 RepID=A0A9N9NNU5_9GLOM|nr:6433_t:CDS:2 [Cetraspora pellucida]
MEKRGADSCKKDLLEEISGLLEVSCQPKSIGIELVERKSVTVSEKGEVIDKEKGFKPNQLFKKGKNLVKGRIRQLCILKTKLKKVKINGGFKEIDQNTTLQNSSLDLFEDYESSCGILKSKRNIFQKRKIEASSNDNIFGTRNKYSFSTDVGTKREVGISKEGINVTKAVELFNLRKLAFVARRIQSLA